ncbi:IS66 family transposase [Variovorax saccharolyticus]|uniref:IS66 family transposase n=1 Tax=Variovorax saccharolyticus TaxID=3053516 RepID=UPI002577A881|nr:IS66 family transposase [Variovorax sp. J31P216]MDM0029905.1 IS66 family transposase [Variovorax sp. J31P216]
MRPGDGAHRRGHHREARHRAGRVRRYRHLRGKGACKCCLILVQEPAAPQIIERGMPAAGLLAHTLVSRIVDHVPYHRQEQINARSGVHTPRSTLAAWAGRTGAQLEPLYGARRAFVLGSQVLHVDETPVAMLDPGAGKTKRAYVWAYARGAFDAEPGVAYNFRASRAARHPVEFLQGWSGTLVCDGYAVCDSGVKLEQRHLAGCAAHARRKLEEVAKDRHSPVATEALQRIAWLYRIEREIKELNIDDRLAVRQTRSVPLWEELHVWLRLERQRVPDGSAIAQAIDHSLNRWSALTRNRQDAAVPIDNNHCENLIRPWAMGRKAWLFAGSELAGQRAAMVMSLLQSARLNGHDPWADLRDVLTRLPTPLNSRRPRADDLTDPNATRRSAPRQGAVPRRLRTPQQRRRTTARGRPAAPSGRPIPTPQDPNRRPRLTQSRS